MIDPAPQFDPTEHERRFPGRYLFHRGLSLDVLGNIPATDLALIDGDHNWYTVFHELEILDTVARAAQLPLPVLVLHDVAWPYGRRDGYYTPEHIPEEFRQPCSPAGIERGRSQLVAHGGLNSHIHNADHEGGPHNGVLTALEDFVEASPCDLRVVVLDTSVGLAIAAEEERLAAHRPLVALFDNVASEAGRSKVRERADDLVRDLLTERARGQKHNARD